MTCPAMIVVMIAAADVRRHIVVTAIKTPNMVRFRGFPVSRYTQRVARVVRTGIRITFDETKYFHANA